MDERTHAATEQALKRRVFLAQVALSFFLLLSVIIYAGRLLRPVSFLNIDLGGRQITTLKAGTIDFFSRLKGPVHIDYFVSGRDSMPSALKEVEASVRALLGALGARFPELLDFRVIDPDVDKANGSAWAAKKGAVPFRVRTILQDEESEQKIWSSMTLSYAKYPSALIPVITPEDLPCLEDMIVEHLRALEKPIRPVFAVAAPGFFRALKNTMSGFGKVTLLDLNKAENIPLDADALFWLDPGPVGPKLQESFQRFVASGRPVLLAGSAYAVSYKLDRMGNVSYRASTPGSGMQTLLEPFGLSLASDLLLDKNNSAVTLRSRDGSIRQVKAPFHITVNPGQTDFKQFFFHSVGALHFVAASPIQTHSKRLASAGYRAQAVATSSENSWVRPLPRWSFADKDVASGISVPKQELMTLLTPNDRRKGRLLVMSSASPLRDSVLNQAGFQHKKLFLNIIRTFMDQQQLVMNRVKRPAPETIPPLKSGERLLWRAATVFMLPGFFILAAVWLLWISPKRTAGRNRLRYSKGWFAALSGPNAVFTIKTLGAALLILLSALVWRHPEWLKGVDVTRDSVNSPSPLARTVLAQYPDLKAELIITQSARMPSSMKKLEAFIRGRLKAYGIPVTRTLRPRELDSAAALKLDAAGISPFEVETIVEDKLVPIQVWSALRLKKGDRTEIIPQVRPRNLDHLEFLIAAAAKRMSTGKKPHIAIHSDLPRLTPAEAWRYYQMQKLVAPQGTDVYSEVKALLRNYGYRTTYINPKSPSIPRGTDVLLWIQPRRDHSKMTELLSRYLARGGKAIVPLQHFNIQQRQYRGGRFKMVYWPQPQYNDLNFYLEQLGIEQVREILMDKTRAHLELDTQVHRKMTPQFESRRVALPFLIRTVGTNFSSASVITANLSNQLFIWGNRFLLDPARLAGLGLKTQTLITTSDRAWRFLWRGGWLPQVLFESQSFLPGRQPLAVLVSGGFQPGKFGTDKEGSRPSFKLSGSRSPSPAPPSTAIPVGGHTMPPPKAEGKRKLKLRDPFPTSPEGSRPSKDIEKPQSLPNGEGELLLIGCSEMFKDGHLYEPGFGHDQFLLNAIAYMAHGPELAGLQAREQMVSGFPYLDAKTKVFLRLFAVGLAPLLFLLYGARRYRRRRV